MKIRALLMKATMVILSYFVMGCSLSEQNTNKTAPVSFITTPASYYSTAKARYLGAKYKDNLDRLAERIVRDSKTATLQFANNISSVGGIGFFTHSATNTPDERYLEVVVSAPETFDRKEAFNDKVARIFAAYGTELLSILAGDPAIYQENEVSGYGLNLTWRSIVQGSTGSRVVLESAVMYFTKETVGAFLHQDMAQSNFLARAIMFAAEENTPLTLISYRQPDLRRDTRLPIHEEAMNEPQIGAKTEPGRLSQPRTEAEAEATPPLALSSDKRSTSNAPDIPRSAAKQQSAVGTGQEQAASNKPTQPARSIQPTVMTKTAERSSVAKRGNEQSDLHKAEQQGGVSQISEVDRLQQIKSANNESKARSAQTSVPETAGRVTKLPEAPTIKKTQPHHAVSGSLVSETPRMAEKAGDEKKVVALSKARSEVQPSPMSVAQPVVLPTHGSQVKGAKPLPSAVAKNAVRVHSPNGEIVAAVPSNGDADKVAGGKNPEAAVVPKSPVKGPSFAPTTTISMPKGNSLSPGGNLSNKQVALLKGKPSETAPENRAVTGARPKALEGYIIQVGFNTKNDAQRWAETLERRGYAVSVTQAGGAGSVRLRLGNFSVREEAERQLTSLKQEGLTGIVINLPQAYRPGMRVPESEASQTHSARSKN